MTPYVYTQPPHTNANSSNSSPSKLGTIVTWKSPSSVDLVSLRSALTAEGFDPDLAKDMLPRSAFSRAARDMTEGRIIRKVEEDDTTIKFQFTKEFLDKQHSEIDYTKETAAYLDKSTGQVTASDQVIASLCNSLVKAHMAKRQSQDVTRLVQKIFLTQGGDLAALRDAGGVYFVPAHFYKLQQRTKRFLAAIGGRLNEFSLETESDTQASVAQGMAEYLNGLVVDFRNSCQNLSPDSRSFLQFRRMKEIGELRDKLEMHKDLLGGFVRSIESEIEQAENHLLAKLSGSAPSGSPVAEEVPENAPAL